MNRAERRSKKKNVEWLTKLAPDKQRIIAELVRDAAKVESREATERMLEQVETCIAASITKNLSDSITFDEIVQVLKDTDEFLLENAEFVHKFRGEWEKKLDSIEPKIIARIKELLKNGKSNSFAYETCKKEFKEIASSHIYNALKAAQEELRKELTVEEVKSIKKEKIEKKEVKKVDLLEELQEQINATAKDKETIEHDLKMLQDKLKEVNKKKNALDTAMNALKEVM